MKLVVHIILMKVILKNFLRWIIGVQFNQEEKLTKLPPCIYVANHNSHLDTACFLALVPAEKFLVTHPVAAADYFSNYRITEWIVKFLFNVVLIDRKNAGGAEATLKPIDDVLKAGHSILFFPEGSRGDPEVMGQFKTGIGLLLKNNPGLPFVPVFMQGLGKAMPKGDPVLVPHESKILVGAPVVIESIQSYTPAEIAQRVREEILKLASLP
jgi:1-acyl-sn-glycerol-3-phosphate acyltransferase